MNKRIDLTGQQINDWLVLKYVGDLKYLCRCSCGKEKIVSTYSLKTGSSKSCGHGNRVYKDIHAGDTFGMLTAKEFIGEGKWKCECTCGRTVFVASKYLKNGKTTSCGKHRMEDLTGLIFGNWTVLKYAGNLKWTCQCKCGKTRDVLTQALKSGRSKSCGCGGKDVAANYRKKMIDKYGDISINRSANPRQRWQIDVISNPDKLKEYIVGITNKIGRKPSIIELVDRLDTSFSTLAKVVHKFNMEDYISIYSNQSHAELELYEYISSIYGGSIIQHNRSLIHPLELDIVLPEKGLAIEFNGDYWHSDLIISDNYYHFNKTTECSKVGYRLIHIFEYEWKHNNTKIKQYLFNLLHTSQAIYAKDTSAVVVNSREANDFLNNYHLHGGITDSINIGLRYNGEIVGLMAFEKSKLGLKYQYKLIRVVYKSMISVVGGSEKLFEYFINKYNPESIVCYSDRSKFSGSVYTRIGMRMVGVSDPSYIWVNSNNGDIVSSYRASETKLIGDSAVEGTLSESSIMSSLGYYRIYDCGNNIYEWKRDWR